MSRAENISKLGLRRTQCPSPPCINYLLCNIFTPIFQNTHANLQLPSPHLTSYLFRRCRRILQVPIFSPSYIYLSKMPFSAPP